MAVTSTTTKVLLVLGTIAFLASPFSGLRRKAKPAAQKAAPLQLRWKGTPGALQPDPQYWALANTLVSWKLITREMALPRPNGCSWKRSMTCN
jgi:hypothetical protein